MMQQSHYCFNATPQLECIGKKTNTSCSGRPLFVCSSLTWCQHFAAEMNAIRLTRLSEWVRPQLFWINLSVMLLQHFICSQSPPRGLHMIVRRVLGQTQKGNALVWFVLSTTPEDLGVFGGYFVHILFRLFLFSNLKKKKTHIKTSPQPANSLPRGESILYRLNHSLNTQLLQVWWGPFHLKHFHG